MRAKSFAAIALSTALIMGGGATTAHAQQQAPLSASPSAEIQLPQNLRDVIYAFLPAQSAEQLEFALQSATGSAALSFGSSAVGSSIIGSSALSLLSN